VIIMAYRYSDNEALNSDGLFFDAVRLKMQPFIDEKGINRGPRHTWEVPGVKIEDNGDVTFSFYAPNAKEVYVAGFMGSAMTNKKRKMTKGEDGYWRVTVSDIPPGFHYHEYFVDGTCVVNPQAPVGYGSHKVVNFFNKPEESDFYIL